LLLLLLLLKFRNTGVVYSVCYLAFNIVAHKDTVDWYHYGGLSVSLNKFQQFFFHFSLKLENKTYAKLDKNCILEITDFTLREYILYTAGKKNIILASYPRWFWTY
jgi:hypothetical protein